MFQHDNTQPHVARICTQFLEAENVPVLPWPAYSPDMSLIEHVWDALDRCVRQRVPVPANLLVLGGQLSQGGVEVRESGRSALGLVQMQVPSKHQLLPTAIEEEWNNSPQATINSLINYAKLCCTRKMLVTPDTDWFSDPQPYLSFKVSVTNRCISVFPCKIYRLGPNEFILND
uniref:Tc1-like transposase DDE domain-containing protein n=1 Tax=Oncorhynchus tshawytscha TaxID=74940 RepID=A0AAZ3P5A2_ONCTS